MKLKLIATAVTAALCTAGTLQAAADLTPPQHRLMQPQLDIKAVMERSVQADEDFMGPLQDDGLNVQIRPQQQKFIAEPDISGPQVYIITLWQQPLATATVMQQQSRKAQAKLYDAGTLVSAELEQYQQQLLNSQQDLVNELGAVIGSAEIRLQYTNAVNGFSMKLTPEQAAEVAKHPQVKTVQRSKLYQLQSDAGPALIGADKVWNGVAAPNGLAYKGEGVIMGVIDTGINTDHPSFASTSDDGYQHENPWGPGNYVGDCTTDNQENLCNDKLIGVRSYKVITDKFSSGEWGASRPTTGEDYQGHGSHVASTAAGNILLNRDFVLPAANNVSDGDLIKTNVFPQLSGVAPRANIVSYQVCYPANDVTAGCPGEALIAGIEDAIKDGVDVINFSIGGQDSHPWSDDVEMAFLAARKAGISVAAAAGNSGQSGGYQEYLGAIDHASPWLLNVAASTHGRDVAVATTLSNAVGGSQAPKWTEIVGGAINTAEVRGLVVNAASFNNEFCGNPFPAGLFDNYKDSKGNPVNVIVVCKRNDINDPNGIARTVKADHVKAAGGDGMIMYNFANTDTLVSTAKYSVPTAHISKQEWDGRFDNGTNGYGLSDWLASGKDHMLTIGATRIERTLDQSKADWLAAFSSRGPSPSTAEALIPAVAAPGVSIYAAFADEQPFTKAPAAGDYAFLSGTSMASPHAAGAMALLRQAHPAWTASEIQSALTMTADNKVQYRRLNEATGKVGLASTYRAGTGRINVANALQAGLIMDESAEDFKAADPKNGGAVHKLNLPQLVNFSCKPKCTWIRTVKATKDGSWKISQGDVLNWAPDMNNQAKQNGVTIKASPEEFSLKAGETIHIVVEASIMDTQDIFSNSEVELHSELRFTEVNGKSPQARWPVVFAFDNNNMPGNLEAVAHRNSGSTLFKGIQLPEGQAYGRVAAPVKAEVKTIELPKDDDNISPWWSGMDVAATPMSQRMDEATFRDTVDVPANARRLIVESLGVSETAYRGTNDEGNLTVYVGKDYNGNGQPDLDSELLCVSSHVVFNNFCNINNPEQGKYWVVLWNSIAGATNNPIKTIEKFKYATAVVTDQNAASMSVDVPVSDGQQPVDVKLNWNLPAMQAEDLYYSVLDFGTSQQNAGNIGKVALKLRRGVDDVSLDVPQTAAKKGDKVPYTFEVLANDSGQERDFTITAKIPAGLSLRKEDVLTSSKLMVDDISVSGDTLTIKGSQPDLSNLEPGYVITTNATDASCKIPDFGNSNPGGYVNLESFGINPVFSGFAPVEYDKNGLAVNGKDNNILTRSGINIPVKDFFAGYRDSFHLYNTGEILNQNKQNSVNIHAFGVVSLWQQPFFFPYTLGFPYQSFPYESIGMLWRGRSLLGGSEIMSVPLVASGQKAGISIAYTQTGWGIIEFDDARSYASAGRDAKRVYQWDAKDDRFDFQLVFNADTRFGDNEHEFYMAYDNISFGTQDQRGAIGLQGFKGQITSFGPLTQYRGEQYAMDDLVNRTFGLKDKIHNGLVLCYDYKGPESSQFEVTAWTTVNSKAAGTAQQMTAVAKFDGQPDANLSHQLNVPGNITLGAITDKTVAENAVLKDVVVSYADEENSVNTISVSGKNIKATASGHKSGSTLTITPDANFHGSTDVTVTVADAENPGDKASTSFKLTVISDGVEKGCTNSAATNYNPGANTDDGSCQLPATAQEPTSKSSGGSFGIFGLTLLGLAGWNRRRH
ncbi:S8 family serine peptidase [Rheinheimera sp. F8]|uniref:S8 family serine peptidase n=1 Tax=Rheinheimera sp. F8 TaxID=1763998 RepID=UPI000744BB69|nr:S8 family serine peptidase [Rheinheimera sp. F8]ALZ74633.1 peptidase S8 [Rheinheimera sp. F8]